MSTSDETTLLPVLRARQYRVDDRARLESLSLLTLLPGPCTRKQVLAPFCKNTLTLHIIDKIDNHA